jgi:hypothetical protein
MKLIDQYKETKSKLENIKEAIINEIVTTQKQSLKTANKYTTIDGKICKFLHVIHYSDMTNSWKAEDYLEKGRVSTELEDLKKELLGAKDLVDKLNKIVNYKNITNRRKWYFQRVDDDLLVKLKELLGDNYYLIPKEIKKRNISRYSSKN